MIKTIFYIKGEDNDKAYFYQGKPYNEFKTLDNILYDASNSIIQILDKNGYVLKYTPSIPHDMFTDSNIIRRIFLY